MDIKIPDCKKFSGYKPCYPYKNCFEEGCAEQTEENKIGKKILIISLDALGNVLDNTPILYSVKRKYPVSTVYWITMPQARDILYNNHLIDRIFIWNDTDRMILKNMKFDLLLNADKSDYACAFANEITAEQKLGFLLNEDGKIIPANESALYSYRLGLNDRLKFRENKKTGVEIIHEVFELEYRKDPYIFNFTEEEKLFIEDYKREINYSSDIIYVGINTGCSNLFPNKKMTIEQHISVINRIIQKENYIILLLGGKEDTERNNIIYNSFNDIERKKIINTPTQMGIRKGACFMDVADIVISGDSFGMHLAIALKKFVIAWFGLSCWTEVELYDNGVKIIPYGLECAPCWKKECPYNLECIKMIDLEKIVKSVFDYKKLI